MTRKEPGVLPAVYFPPVVMVPPVAVQFTRGGAVDPLDQVAVIVNCWLPPGATDGASGDTERLDSVTGMLMTTEEVSALPLVCLAITRYVPAVDPAVYRLPDIVPPVAA